MSEMEFQLPRFVLYDLQEKRIVCAADVLVTIKDAILNDRIEDHTLETLKENVELRKKLNDVPASGPAPKDQIGEGPILSSTQKKTYATQIEILDAIVRAVRSSGNMSHSATTFNIGEILRKDKGIYISDATLKARLATMRARGHVLSLAEGFWTTKELIDERKPTSST